MGFFRCFAAAVLILAATAVFAGETVMIDGVPHILNGTEPANGVQTIELRELWSVGGEADEENFFGLITAVDADSEGNIYVLDGQLCQVSVYSPRGELIRTLFREGDGPGEVRQPRDMVLMPDGRIGLVQEFPGKIVFVDAEGNPAGELSPGSQDPTAGGFTALAGADCRGGSMVLAGIQTKPGERAGTQERKLYLAAYDPAGELRSYMITRDTMFDFNNFVLDESVHVGSFFWNHALDAEGMIYAVPAADRYAINVYAPDGTPVKVIEREFELRQRSKNEINDFRRLVDGSLRNFPGTYEIKVTEYSPVVPWLQPGVRIAGNGDLWILNSYGNVDQPEGVMVSYDVFDREGVFDHIVRVACDGDGMNDGLFCVTEDRFVLVRGYTDAVASTFGAMPEETDGQDSEPMGITYYELVR